MISKEELDKVIADIKEQERFAEASTLHPDLAKLEYEAFHPVEQERPYYHPPPEYPEGFYAEVGHMRADIEGNSIEELTYLEKNDLLKYETIAPAKEKAAYVRKVPKYLFNGSIERLKRLEQDEVIDEKAVEEVFTKEGEEEGDAETVV